MGILLSTRFCLRGGQSSSAIDLELCDSGLKISILSIGGRELSRNLGELR
jgi:hypothetical protein